MVLTQNWEGVLPQDKELYEALQPNVMASISLSGGLRAPRQGAWLRGYGPDVRVNAFAGAMLLDIFDVDDPEEPLKRMEVVSNKNIMDFPQLEPGTYLLKAYEEGGLRPLSRRPLRILDWSSLDTVAPDHPEVVRLNGFTLEGSIVRANRDNQGEQES